jgi:transposase
MVDLTRDQDGCLHARLLDAVVGRSGTAYKTWLQNQPDGFSGQVEQAALDPFRGYANAIRDELPDAVAVLDVFHVTHRGHLPPMAMIAVPALPARRERSHRLD